MKPESVPIPRLIFGRAGIQGQTIKWYGGLGIELKSICIDGSKEC